MTDFSTSGRLRRYLSVAGLGLAFTAALPGAASYAAASVNKGDTTWMLVSTILVILMTIPGLALFYGGLVRSKNMLSVLMQVLTCFCLIAILWMVYGYSIAFSNGNAFFGGFSKVLLSGVTLESLGGTFSKETYIPEYAFVIFQLTFAAITPALIIGAFAERMKFSAMLLFTVLWFTFAYLPMAHMVWWWAGPDAYTLSMENIDVVKAAVGEEAATKFLADLAAATTDEAKAAVLAAYSEAASAYNGWLFSWGAIDFAGGTVVHINAGIAALVCAIVIGPRVGFNKEPMPPHNLVFTYIGACLLWVGWFGFNAGSNLESNSLTALVVLNTILATAAATLAWSIGEKTTRGHPSLLGAASGAIAGLVAITPACGWVGPIGAIVIGIAAGFICLWAVVWLKAKLGYDDSLDVFGVHGVGGIIGALLTGIFVNPSWGGAGVVDYLATDTSYKVAEYSFSGQMKAQIVGVLTALIWSGVVAFVALMICKAVTGLRVSEQDEREGLDISEHGERAYN
jgi:Amt family ammonium transporter